MNSTGLTASGRRAMASVRSWGIVKNPAGIYRIDGILRNHSPSQSASPQPENVRSLGQVTHGRFGGSRQKRMKGANHPKRLPPRGARGRDGHGGAGKSGK